MRRISYVLLAAVFCCFLFAQTGTIDDPYPLYKTDTVKIVWDNPAGIDLAELVAGEVAIYTEAGASGDMTKRVLTKMLVFQVPGAPKNAIPLKPEIDALPDGTYWCSVRIQRVDMVWSPFAAEVVIKKNWVPWSPPAGCRIGW